MPWAPGPVIYSPHVIVNRTAHGPCSLVVPVRAWAWFEIGDVIVMSYIADDIIIWTYKFVPFRNKGHSLSTTGHNLKHD